MNDDQPVGWRGPLKSGGAGSNELIMNNLSYLYKNSQSTVYQYIKNFYRSPVRINHKNLSVKQQKVITNSHFQN